MDKAYKITNVQARDPWTGKFGTFNAFALQLEGVDGWVELSQKPETQVPVVGAELFGHLDSTTRGDNTYLKFRKASPNGGNNSGGNNAQLEKDIAYVIMMLEELTLRRQSPDDPTPRDDVLPTDEEGSKPLKLEDIPF
jgi:hypothetical protein